MLTGLLDSHAGTISWNPACESFFKVRMIGSFYHVNKLPVITQTIPDAFLFHQQLPCTMPFLRVSESYPS